MVVDVVVMVDLVMVMVDVVVVDVMVVVDVVVMVDVVVAVVVDVGSSSINSKGMEYLHGGHLGFENPIQNLLFCS